MNTRDREWIKKRVAVRADEFAIAASTVGGNTALEDPIETIEDELDLSAIFVLRNAREDFLYPLIKGDKKYYHGDYVKDVDVRLEIDDEDLSALIVLPQDYLRFVSLKLDSWKREVRELIDPRSPEYRSQKQNAFTGGSIYKPSASYGPYAAYECKVTGTITGTFVVGETVTGTGGVSGITGFTGRVKTVESAYIILDMVSGSLDIAARGNNGFSGDTSSATMGTITDIQDEFNRYKVIKRYTSNTALSTLFNGEVIGGLTLATGDLIVLPVQTDPEESGTYLIGANAGALLKITSDINTPFAGSVLEAFRAQSTSDEIDILNYIPRLKPEEMPEEILDATIDVCASRVLKYLGRVEAANIALQSAAQLMGAQSQGFKVE